MSYTKLCKKNINKWRKGKRSKTWTNTSLLNSSFLFVLTMHIFMNPLGFEGAPRAAARIPHPEVSLLPEALQTPVQIHAALVSHGGVAVSGTGS